MNPPPTEGTSLMHLLPAAPAVFRRALRSRSGAFDMQSILVGSVVTSILAGGVYATIFGAMPWAQDNTASQRLMPLHSAQNAAKTGNGGFRDTASLVVAGHLEKSTPVVTATNAAKTCYVGLAESQTGKILYVTDTVKDPVALAATATNVPGGCLTDTQFSALKGSIGTAPGSGAVTLTAPVITAGPPDGTQVQFSWAAVPGAEFYTVDYRIGASAWLSFDPKVMGTSVTVPGKVGYTVSVYVRAAAGPSLGLAGTATSAVISGMPGKPVVNVTSTSSGKAAFDWANSANATSYRVEFRVNGGPWQVKDRHQKAVVDPAVNAVSLTAADGDTIEVRVTAIGEIGSSAAATSSALAVDPVAP